MGHKWAEIKKAIPDIPRFRSLLLKEDEGAVCLLSLLIKQYDLSESFIYIRFGYTCKAKTKSQLRKDRFLDMLKNRSGYEFSAFKKRLKANAYDAIKILKEVFEESGVSVYFLGTIGLNQHDLKRTPDDGISKPNNRKGVNSTGSI